MDSAIFVIAADSKSNTYFQTLLTEVGNSNFTGFTTLSKNLTDFFCVATGARNFYQLIGQVGVVIYSVESQVVQK